MNNFIRNRAISNIVRYHLWTINESYDKISPACPGTNTVSIRTTLRGDVNYFLSETFSQKRSGKLTMGRYAKQKKNRYLPVTCTRTIQRRKRSWVMRFRVLLIIIKKRKQTLMRLATYTKTLGTNVYRLCR